ncbi:Uncharacterised protein [Chryseobacterium nakagawai]|nr:Uncharacterised protein [Chryseobacterium nakagawai]
MRLLLLSTRNDNYFPILKLYISGELTKYHFIKFFLNDEIFKETQCKKP